MRQSVFFLKNKLLIKNDVIFIFNIAINRFKAPYFKFKVNFFSPPYYHP